MPETTVVHVSSGRQTVYIGRPGFWGNPFVIGPDGDREEVIRKFAIWITGQPERLARLGELRGQVLGCYCAPLPCHGDVLAALADDRPVFYVTACDRGGPP